MTRLTAHDHKRGPNSPHSTFTKCMGLSFKMWRAPRHIIISDSSYAECCLFTKLFLHGDEQGLHESCLSCIRAAKQETYGQTHVCAGDDLNDCTLISMATTPPAPSPEGSENAPLPQQALSHPAPVNRRPTLPSSFFKFPIRARLKVIQQYISSFEYKQSPQTSFNSHKSRPLARIMDTAKMMIYNPQPIKCVEAVFLALFLTAGIPNAERIPLGFKSVLHGQVHQHIVLLVRYNSKYGAFGISRQHNLMSKEFEFESISSIVEDFRKAYEKYEHTVVRIRVGLPVEHNIESFNFVCWRHLSLDPSSASWDQCSEALERHMTHAKRLWERWLLDGQRENRRADVFLKNLDTKPAVEFQENSSQKKTFECNLATSTVKAVKRRQEPDKQEPDFKLVKRRQALREMPPSANILNQPLTCKVATKLTSKIKALPPLPLKNFPRDLPTSIRRCSRCQSLRNEALFLRPMSATHKKNIKKIALKCYSMELFSGSCKRLALQTNDKKPKVNQRVKGSVRKSEVPKFPAELPTSRTSSRKKAEATIT